MNRRIIALLAFLGLGISAPAMADRNSALEALRAQDGVISVRMDARGTAYVVVKQAKWDWNSWARSACRLVKPHQGQIFHIRVSLVTEVKPGQSPEKWPRLGESLCR